MNLKRKPPEMTGEKLMDIFDILFGAGAGSKAKKPDNKKKKSKSACDYDERYYDDETDDYYDDDHDEFDE